MNTIEDEIVKVNSEIWDSLKGVIDADILEIFTREHERTIGQDKVVLPAWYYTTSPHLVAAIIQLSRNLKKKL